MRLVTGRPGLFHDMAEVVEHTAEVGGPNPPDGAEVRVVEPDAESAGIEMRGLDDDRDHSQPKVYIRHPA